MRTEFRPLFVVPATINAHKTTFYRPKEQVVVNAPGTLVRRLVDMCDGTRELSVILDELRNEWNADVVRDFLRALSEHKVIVDSQRFDLVVTELVQNPSRFFVPVTDDEASFLADEASHRQQEKESEFVFEIPSFPLKEALESRQSTRSFSGEPVSADSVHQLLWAAYGRVRRNAYRKTVPSAGALYPLAVSVVLFKKTADLEPGVYHVHAQEHDVNGVTRVADGSINTCIRAFADPLVLTGAHGVVVVSGSFAASAAKYGNRSILHVPLEAGHAAQNIHLAAHELGVGTVEIGGFFDELLSSAVCLPVDHYPLVAVVFGKADSSAGSAREHASDVEVRWAIPVSESGSYQLPFTMAFARSVSKADGEWSCGRSMDPVLAHTKATAEAREWAACGLHDSLTSTRGRMSDIHDAIDPREVFALHPAQYRVKGFPLKPFDKTVEYLWIRGEDVFSGEAASVLADCVCFPYRSDSPQYANASSSGVAAHPKKEVAIKNSLLELVERDAFMATYLAKLQHPTVRKETVPEDVQKRISALEQVGFKVWVKEFTLDLAPVLFVFAQNEEDGCTICSASAEFDQEEALNHALMEVEAAALVHLDSGESDSCTSPREVRTPRDHGTLYSQKRFFRSADFLVQTAAPEISFRDVGKAVPRTWRDLLDQLERKVGRLVTIPMHSGERGADGKPLHIIRSVVPGLIPISFGYRQEPCGMERVYTLAWEKEGRALNYAEMPKFPHPFT